MGRSLYRTLLSFTLLLAACAKGGGGSGGAGSVGGDGGGGSSATDGALDDAATDDGGGSLDDGSPPMMCTAATCDDGDACTTDACDPASGCSHEPIVPAGSGCEAPIALAGPGTVSATTSCAPSASPARCGSGDGPDVFFRFDLAERSRVTLATTGSSFDPVLALGDTCPPTTGECSDDGPLGRESQVVADLEPGTYYVQVEAKPGTPAGDFQLALDVVPLRPVTLDFPTPGDAVSPSHGYLWTLGAYTEGTRSVTLPAPARSVRMHLVIAENSLSCDTQDMRLLVAGLEAGRFAISSGDTAIDRTFSLPSPVNGPTVALRYETVRQVASGCGSAKLATAGSTITLVP